MGLSAKDKDRIVTAQRHWSSKGEVQAATALARALAADEMPKDKSLLNLTAIRPQTNIDVGEEGVEIPPRTGKGSGIENWREFAKATSSMDPDVIDEMGKPDIIENLEAAGVIPAEAEEEA